MFVLQKILGTLPANNVLPLNKKMLIGNLLTDEVDNGALYD